MSIIDFKSKYVKCEKCGVTRNIELATECAVCVDKVNYAKSAGVREKLKKALELRKLKNL